MSESPFPSPSSVLRTEVDKLKDDRRKLRGQIDKIERDSRKAAEDASSLVVSLRSDEVALSAAIERHERALTRLGPMTGTR